MSRKIRNICFSNPEILWESTVDKDAKSIKYIDFLELLTHSDYFFIISILVFRPWFNNFIEKLKIYSTMNKK